MLTLIGIYFQIKELGENRINQAWQTIEQAKTDKEVGDLPEFDEVSCKITPANRQADGSITTEAPNVMWALQGLHLCDPRQLEPCAPGERQGRDERSHGSVLRNVGAKEALETLNEEAIDLSGIELPNAYLSGANLRHAKLRGAVLSGADLSGAIMSNANLRLAQLDGANLKGANLRGADVSGADLQNARLNGADLRETNLSSAKMKGADLSGGTNLSGAILRDAHLEFANISYANMSMANLVNAKLQCADLFKAKFCESVLIGAKGLDSRHLKQESENWQASEGGHARKVETANFFGIKVNKLEFEEIEAQKKDKESDWERDCKRLKPDD